MLAVVDEDLSCSTNGSLVDKYIPDRLGWIQNG